MRLLFLIASLLCLPSALPAETIRIGVIAPLSGPLASVGVAIRRSVQLAHDQFPERDRIELRFEDDAFVPKQSVAAARKLIGEDKVAALIIFGSSTSLSVSEIAEQSRVPMIALAIAPSITQNKQSVVRFAPSAEEEGRLVAAEAARRNYESVAVVSTTQDGMLALRDSFLETTKARIVLNEEFLPEDTDLRGVATKIQLLKPSAVLIMLLPPQVSLLTRRLREVGYRGDFFGGPQLNVPTEIAAAQGTLAGAWFVNVDDSGAGDYYREFAARFKDSTLIEGLQSYVAADLAFRAALSGDLNHYLHTVKDLPGMLGTISADGANGFTIPVAVGKIKG